ncbi:MAG: hypothetical protein FK732_02010 [Asgard group archaeon]|nr:hypothetical protein [Asgard group archaeon]
MSGVLQSKKAFLALSFVFLISFSIPFISSFLNYQNSMEVFSKTNNNTIPSTISPNEGFFKADVHWVKTDIILDEFGLGEVTILVNCTPFADHEGILFSNFELNEVSEIQLDETFAYTSGQKVNVNVSASGNADYDYLLYLANTSYVNTSETIQYQFRYLADFALSDQIGRFQVDTTLAVIDLIRPIWDAELEFQEFSIRLPVILDDSVVTQENLNDSRFSVASYMNTYYNLSYSTFEDADGIWLVFNCKKENMGPRAPFDVNFYLSMDYFSLPKVFNWLVLLFVFLFVTAALVLFIAVINVRNKTDSEVTKFQEQLQELLKPKEK